MFIVFLLLNLEWLFSMIRMKKKLKPLLKIKYPTLDMGVELYLESVFDGVTTLSKSILKWDHWSILIKATVLFIAKPFFYIKYESKKLVFPISLIWCYGGNIGWYIWCWLLTPCDPGRAPRYKGFHLWIFCTSPVQSVQSPRAVQLSQDEDLVDFIWK